MKHLIRTCVISSIVLGLAPLICAQERSFKAEFECLMMTGASGNPIPAQKSQFDSFHHVWMPGLGYGHFKSNNLELLYEVEGEGRETVIVVPGGPGLPHDYFHPAMSALSRYVRLIYFDRRADFLSARSKYEMASLDEMADDVDALRQSLGLNRVTLLGHSFGAAIALNYALRYPTRVKRLILVGASAAIENPVEVEARIVKMLSPDEMKSYRSSEGGTGAASACERVRRLYRALYPRYFYKAPDARTMDKNLYAIYFDALARKQIFSSDLGGFDVRDKLAGIKAPALVVAGRYDVVTPLNQASEIVDRLPYSKLAVMEHSGHFPFIEENYLFTQWVRQFIAETASVSDDETMSAPTETLTQAPSGRSR